MKPRAILARHYYRAQMMIAITIYALRDAANVCHFAISPFSTGIYMEILYMASQKVGHLGSRVIIRAALARLPFDSTYGASVLLCTAAGSPYREPNAIKIAGARPIHREFDFSLSISFDEAAA